MIGYALRLTQTADTCTIVHIMEDNYGYCNRHISIDSRDTE